MQGSSELLDLRIAPEHIYELERVSWGQGPNTIESPEFVAQRLMLSTTLRPDTPHLLGTINPPPPSEGDADPNPEVWFAFITMTRVN